MISQQTKEELKQLLTHIEENTLNLLESSPPDNVLKKKKKNKDTAYAVSLIVYIWYSFTNTFNSFNALSACGSSLSTRSSFSPNKY